MDTHFANMRSLIQVRVPGTGIVTPRGESWSWRGSGGFLGSRRDSRGSKDSLEQYVPGEGGRSWCIGEQWDGGK